MLSYFVKLLSYAHLSGASVHIQMWVIRRGGEGGGGRP